MATMSPNMTERRIRPDRRSVRQVSKSKQMNPAEWIPMLLLAIGGLNWGLIGLFNFNLVSYLFGEMTLPSRIIYAIVGVCALYCLYLSGRISSKKP